MRRALLVVLGFVIGGVCLWLASRSVDWQEAARIFHSASASWIAAGLGLFAIDMVLRAWRWRTILAFREHVGLGVTLQALLAGYATNTLLPARLGEFYRAHYLASRAGLSGSAVLASIVIERLLDLIAVICALALGLALAGGGDSTSQQVLIGGAALAAAAVLTLAAIVALLSRYPAEDVLRRILRLPGGAAIARRGGPMLTNFTQALQCVRTRHFPAAILFTLPIWVLETAAVWSICRAVGIDLDLTGMLSLLGGIALSTMVPTAPGYVGSLQAVFVVILAQFGIGATLAIVGATAAQVYLIGGFTLLGLVVMAVSALLPRR